MGQWLVRALSTRRADLGRRYAVEFSVVGIANRRDGFMYREDGVDLQAALDLAAADRSLRELPDVSDWPSALDGMRATEADVLVEVSASPASSAEPGRSHLEEALGRGISAVTSNKWPVALHALELADVARAHSAQLRAESTVMSGTPVLSTLTEGLAGASPTTLRGVLNATANFILSELARGERYSDALARARRKGLVERDPGADVDGHDTAAKLMILATLVFGCQLRLEDVDRRGISSLTDADVRRARSEGLRIRELATLRRSAAAPGSLVARIEPVALAAEDPLSGIDGIDNAVICSADPIGEITVIGPGAGPELAGQGVLSDLLNVAMADSRS